MHLILTAVACALLASPASEDSRGVLRDLLERAPYQTELPRAGTGDFASPVRTGRDSLTGRPREGRSPSIPTGVVEPMQRIFRGLLWVLMGVAVFLLALWIVRGLRGYARDREIELEEEEEGSPEATGPPAKPKDQDDWVRLAREGRFGDAIHALLIRALDELARSTGEVITPSRTSREILQGLSLPEESERSLANLVFAVERSEFGGVTPGEREYRRSVEDFRSLTGLVTEGRP